MLKNDGEDKKKLFDIGTGGGAGRAKEAEVKGRQEGEGVILNRAGRRMAAKEEKKQKVQRAGGQKVVGIDGKPIIPDGAVEMQMQRQSVIQTFIEESGIEFNDGLENSLGAIFTKFAVSVMIQLGDALRKIEAIQESNASAIDELAAVHDAQNMMNGRMKSVVESLDRLASATGSSGPDSDIRWKISSRKFK